MSREWKPGDVGTAFISRDQVMRLRNGGWVDWDGDRYNGDLDPRVRPLVVIDPEDLRELGRLEALIDSWRDRVPYSDMAEPGDLQPVTALQAALRELADPKPPRPGEPTGLGAVIEDAKGRLWTSAYRDGGSEWVPSNGARPSKYADIDVVRVLSEGVTP